MAAVTLPGLDRVAARALARVEFPIDAANALGGSDNHRMLRNALGGSDNHWSYSNSV